MKKVAEEQLVQTNEAAYKNTVATDAPKVMEGGPNPEWPQEYEEDRSMDIRMIPQPLYGNGKE